MKLVHDAAKTELLSSNLGEVVARDLCSPGSLTEIDHVKMRAHALDIACKIAIAKGKPGHAPYIASDVYQFLLTGRKPLGPQEKSEIARPSAGEGAPTGAPDVDSSVTPGRDGA